MPTLPLIRSYACQVVSLVIQRMRASCLFRAFSSWHDRARCKIAAKQRLAQAVAALMKGQLRRCWASWLDFVDARLAAKGRMLSAMAHWKERMVVACFRRWKEKTLAVRTVHKKSREVLMRIIVKLKACARLISTCDHISALLTFPYEKRRAEAGNRQKCLQLDGTALQGEAWNSWRDHATAQQAKRDAMRLCLLRLRQGTTGRLFREWHGECQRRAVLRATARSCMQRLQHLLLSRAFAAWVNFPAQQQEAR